MIQISNRCFSSMTHNQFSRYVALELKIFKEKGTYKNERVIKSAQNVKIEVENQPGEILNFCANNYLGLCNHPDVVQAAKNALDTFGAGVSSVRFICGTQTIHKELERKLSQFHKREDTILYGSCFDANAGIFDALLGSGGAIISDSLNHASIIDGIKLAKRQQRSVYNHCNMHDLEDKLIATQRCQHRLIVTDGVFSMDGDVAPLKDICYLADKYNALVMVDDCHATGFFGKTGRGTEEYMDVMGRVDIINSTLGKALGGAMGGYTTSSKLVIDLLRQKSRPYLFSNSLAPAMVATALKSIDLVMKQPELYQSLHSKVQRFRTKMKSAGFNILGNDDHPICPVLFGNAKIASQFADEMLNEGIYVIAFSFPVVSVDQARIRVQISADHNENDIDRCVDAFINVAKKLKELL